MKHLGYVGIFTILVTLSSIAVGDDNTDITVNGVGTNIPGTLLIGDTGTNNSLHILNGGSVTNDEGIIGNNASASNNFVIVDGTGSLWTNTFSGGFEGTIVGKSGRNNSLTISNGGRVDSQDGILGRFGGANNNTVLVTGNNSLWNITRYFDVGTLGAGNQLIVSNGARVVSGTASGQTRIGGTFGADNNTAIVTGNGSLWTNSTEILIGTGGGASGNQLFVTDGGQVVASTIHLGDSASNLSNRITVAGANAHLTTTGTGGNDGVMVGWIGSYNQLFVTNGGRVDTFQLVLSRFAGDNNSVLIDGANSVVNATNVVVGVFGKTNQLILSNGGHLNSGNEADIGGVAGADNNLVVVTGSGSSWTNNGGAFDLVKIGAGAASYNRLVISNGASAYFHHNGGNSTSATIGDGSGSQGNSVEVTGSGSVMTNTGFLLVGAIGKQNQLIVSDGAAVHALDIYTGRFGGSDSNSIVVTGNNSLLNVTRFFDLGTSSGGNQLTVSNGGKMSVVNEIRMGATAGGDNNIATVTGAGSLWSNQNNLVVGDASGGNQLIIANGGTVRLTDAGNTGTSLIIGRSATSSNNLVRLDGGNLIVTNSTGATPGIDVRRGSLVLNSGTVWTERLLANTGASSDVQFNGGTLVTEGTTVANGNTFVVGDGVSVARLHLQGGTHSFANGLSISANGTLSGNGTVSGPTTVQGTLAPGNSPGLIHFGDLTLDTNSTFAVELNGLTAGTQYDQADVTGLVTLSNGFLSVLIGFSPVLSNQFVIINNDGGDAVSGIFNGLTEGSIVSGGGATKLSISYIGGDGNDVVLTFLVPEPTSAALLALGLGVIFRLRRR